MRKGVKNRKDGISLKIHGDGSQTRDFIHVEDICDANIIAMSKDDLINETINVGTGTMVSIKEIANIISENQEHTESRKVDLKHTLCDIEKMERLLNWKPKHNIIDYLSQLVSM